MRPHLHFGAPRAGAMLRIPARLLLPVSFLLLLAVVPLAGAAPASFNGAWTNLTPGGVRPPARRDVGAAYDSRRDQLVVVAGDATTWRLALSGTPTWTMVTGVTPPGVTGDERAVYDPVGDRMILVTSNMVAFELSLANPIAWSQVPLQGGNAPPARSFFAVTLDALRNRLIVFGGGPYTGLFNDIWVLTLSGPPTWTQIQPSGTGPLPRWGPIAAYDTQRDRLLVGTGSTTGDYATTNDIWAVGLSGAPFWTQLTPPGPLPAARLLAGAIYDPGGDRLLIFGGYPNPTSDTWELGLSSAPAWTQLAPTGGPPTGRWSSSFAYRSSVPQMLVYGGFSGSPLNDTWALGLAPLTGPPLLLSFSPAGGVTGDPVVLVGERLSGVTNVRFHNGVEAPFTVVSPGRIDTSVPPGAITGPIEVTSPEGSSQSSTSFFIESAPELYSVNPDSGRIGDTVELRGRYLASASRAVFGGTGIAAVQVLSDTALNLTVDANASSGPITVTTAVASRSSAFDFTVIPDDPRPRLLGVRDVSADQGGRVMLTWRASDFDQPRHRNVTGYRVWRRAPVQSQPPSATSAVAPSLPDGALPAGSDQVFWEALDDLPAAYLPGYAYTAATLRDSTADGNPHTAYFVQTLTTDPFEFHASSVDSGYSVDNLSPPTPTPFVATYTGSANYLHWRLRSIPDFREFRLYRGDAADFPLTTATLVATTPDTSHVDIAGNYFYKLVAVDLHGNVSRIAMVSPDRPVATLAALVSAESFGDRIRLLWYSGGDLGITATLYRRTPTTGWEAIGTLQPNGEGYLRFEDRDIIARETYGYRLGIQEPGESEAFFGEAWVTADAPTLSFESIYPNPTPDGTATLAFTLASSASARVEMFDVTGRKVFTREVGSLGAGRHTLELSTGIGLRPGVYLVRLTQLGTAIGRRLLLMN